jgi:ABC-type tungstate transport system substrate-binding protein
MPREANGRRNDLVHGLKAPNETGLETIRSRRNTHLLTAKAWRLSEIRTVSRALVVAGNGLQVAMVSAFGPEVVEIGETLRREGT